MCVGATPIIMVVGRQEVGFLVESISIHEGGSTVLLWLRRMSDWY